MSNLPRPDIVFVHTSPVHVDTFGRLTQAADPALHVEHVVLEHLLAEAQIEGADNPALIKRVQDAMIAAASTGAKMVVCSCSTIGGAAEKTPTGGRFAAARIDRAMADRAVCLGPNVLVVAALESTLGPTTELIRESATALRKQVSIEHLLVREAWPHFQSGEHAAFLGAVAAAVRAALPGPDVVVLAQASMAPAAEALRDVGVEVLASPLLGVQKVVAGLRTGRTAGEIAGKA
jgi:hypothetical protein